MPSSSTEESTTARTSTATSPTSSADYQKADTLPDPPPKAKASETPDPPKAGLVTLARAKDGSHVATVNLKTISQDEIRGRIERMLNE